MPEYYQPDVYALLAARQYNPQLLGYQRALAVGQGITNQLQNLGDDIVRQKMLRQQQAATAEGNSLASGSNGGVRGAMQAVDFQSAMARQRRTAMAAQLDAARAAGKAQVAPAQGGSGGATAPASSQMGGLNAGGALKNAFDYFSQSRRLQHALTAAGNEDDYNKVADGIQALYTAARTNGLKVDAPEIEPWAGPLAPAGVGSISPDAPAVDAGDDNAQPDARMTASVAQGAAPNATPGAPSQTAVNAGMVPPGAIQALRADPTLRDQFDAKYGPGLGAFMLGR